MNISTYTRQRDCLPALKKVAAKLPESVLLIGIDVAQHRESGKWYGTAILDNYEDELPAEDLACLEGRMLVQFAKRSQPVTEEGTMKRPRLAPEEYAHSKAEGPVALFHTLANRYTDLTRKELLEKAVAAGITINTARTRYTVWKKSKKTEK